MRLGLILITLLSFSVFSSVRPVVRNDLQQRASYPNVCSETQKQNLKVLTEVACRAKLDELEQSLGLLSCSIKKISPNECQGQCFDLSSQKIIVNSELHSICHGPEFNVKLVKTVVVTYR